MHPRFEPFSCPFLVCFNPRFDPVDLIADIIDAVAEAFLFHGNDAVAGIKDGIQRIGHMNGKPIDAFFVPGKECRDFVEMIVQRFVQFPGVYLQMVFIVYGDSDI